MFPDWVYGRLLHGHFAAATFETRPLSFVIRREAKEKYSLPIL